MAKKIRTRKIVRQEVFDPKLQRKVKFDGQGRSHLVGKSGGAVPKRIRKARQAAAAGIGKAFLETVTDARSPDGNSNPDGLGGGTVAQSDGGARRTNGVDGQSIKQGDTGDKVPELRAKPGGGNWPAVTKKRNRKAWQEASRNKGEAEKEAWTPTPRGDLAHFLKLARQGGVAVRSKAEMPAVHGYVTTAKMSKAFFQNLQPLHNAYNGQGLARASVCLEIAHNDFRKQFNRVFAEHVGEWGRRHLKAFKSEKDLGMEWRQRLKQKQAADPTVFVSKAARSQSKKEKKLVDRQAAMAIVAAQKRQVGRGFAANLDSAGFSEFSA